MMRAGGRKATFVGLVSVLVLLPAGAWTAGLASSAPAPTNIGASYSGVVPGAVGLPSGGTVAPATTACALSLPIPCGVQSDQPVVNLESNSSGSGDEVQWNVTLPPSGTDPAAVETAFWTGLWVTGAPCSIDGASYLRVVLYPPESPEVEPPSADWVAEVPVTDLVPAGSCDPLCQNASAVTTVNGVAACEDDIVRDGGRTASAAVGRFAPGDDLTITFWGNASAPGSPLTVWVNDSTVPPASAMWSYGSAATVTGVPVAPRYATSTVTDAGWLTPIDAAFGVTDCPAVPGRTPCLSYDGPVANLSGSSGPTVSDARFWNRSSGSWAAFSGISTASTSGACSSLPTLAACPDFEADGGDGYYPTLSVVRTDGGSAWRLGGSAGVLGGYGGRASEYLTNGNATEQDPGIINVSSSGGLAGAANLTGFVADPRGLAQVRATALWCSPTGPSITTVQAAASGTLANLSLALSVAAENGTMTAWVSERAPGAPWSPGVAVPVRMTGGTSACSPPAPPPPWFGATNVTSVAGGYRLTWAENTSDVLGFSLRLQPVGPGSPEMLRLGNGSSATVTGLNASERYNLTLEVLGLSGATANSTVPDAPLPDAALTISAAQGATTAWHGSPSAPVALAIAGGAAPYTIVAALSNGTNQTVVTSNTTTNVSLPVDAGEGFVAATVRATDADGVTASAAPLVWDVWTGPLAPAVTVTAGESYLDAVWPTPGAPVTAVTNYTVFVSSNSSRAPGAPAGGSTNTSVSGPAGGVEVWNTTNGSALIPWADNVTGYVVVVPHDALGAGFENAVPANGTPAPIAATILAGGPGGAAPYTSAYSAVVRTGTNDPIDEAIYSFPGFQFVDANITRTNATTAYVNATATVDTIGLDLVVLHVSDAFGGVAVVTEAIWVTTGAPPAVTAQANPSPDYVGVPVNYSASATGTGPFEYNWTFGDGTNASGASVLHTYAAAGTYTAHVSVSDHGTGAVGGTDVVEVVYANPSVVISDGAGPNGSGSFEFHATLLGGSGNGSFEWTFGDGATGRGENTTHDYLASGTYHVTVIATDSSLRSANASLTLAVVLPGSSTGTGPGTGGLTPLADSLIAIAVAGWAVAIVLFLRRTAPPEDDEDDDDE